MLKYLGEKNLMFDREYLDNIYIAVSISSLHDDFKNLTVERKNFQAFLREEFISAFFNNFLLSN